jgi:uncharacterized membrane protein YkoI
MHPGMMKFLPAFFALAVALPLVPAHAEKGGEQGEVRRERQAGNVRSLRDIERQIVPRMSGMQYLGPEYDPAAMAYRLKFIDKGKVYFVDVDARTGRIISQTR